MKACTLCGEVKPPEAFHRMRAMKDGRHPQCRECRKIYMRAKYGYRGVRSVEERLWARVDKSPGCWVWTGSTNGKGYGQIHHNVGARRMWLVHRLAYEMLVGPVPAGLVLDHLCRNKRCCNPAHLEPVTSGENIRRGYAVKRQRAAVA